MSENHCDDGEWFVEFFFLSVELSQISPMFFLIKV